jgi:hypothetical protein
MTTEKSKGFKILEGEDIDQEWYHKMKTKLRTRRTVKKEAKALKSYSWLMNREDWREKSEEEKEKWTHLSKYLILMRMKYLKYLTLW